MKAPARRKAHTTSQTVELAKPASTCAVSNVFVKRRAVRPIIAIAPIGKGLAMIPATVATKIARSRQACSCRPSGGGMNQRTTPTAKTHKRRQTFVAPDARSEERRVGKECRAGWPANSVLKKE